MADKRITELNVITAPAATDEVLISDTSASETKKITIQNLFKVPTGTVVETNALVSPVAGQLVFVTNNSSGACLAVYDGSAWKIASTFTTIA